MRETVIIYTGRKACAGKGGKLGNGAEFKTLRAHRADEGKRARNGVLRQIVHQDDIARLRVGKKIRQHLCGLVFIPVVRVHGPENDG